MQLAFLLRICPGIILIAGKSPTQDVYKRQVVSPILAAGLPQIITVEDPLMIVSGGPTQTQLSPITAAGSLPIRTVAAPGPTIGPVSYTHLDVYKRQAPYKSSDRHGSDPRKSG